MHNQSSLQVHNRQGLQYIVQKVVMLDESQDLVYGKYKFMGKLGHGSYGEVISIKYEGKQYALKKVDLKDYNDDQTKVLGQMNHPNILRFQFVDKRENKGYVLIATEYCNQKDMCKYQETLPGGVYGLNQAIQGFYQVLQGVQYMHNKKITHRDLKPSNIFINEEKGQFTYKIGDFGLSTFKALCKSQIGTLMFQAPEMQSTKDQETSYDRMIDVWALGVCLFYMLTRKYPFPSESSEQRKNDINAKCNPFKFSSFSGSSNGSLEDLFKRIFVVDPRKRITVNELIAHPIFNGISKSSDTPTQPLKEKLSLQETKPNHPLETKHSLPNLNNMQNQLYEITRNKYIRERQINNIFMSLISKLNLSSKYFTEEHHIVLIYNTLKLYVINHNKIRRELRSLQENSTYQDICKGQWFQSFGKTIEQELRAAYKKYFQQFDICNSKIQRIKKTFGSSQYQVIINKEIEEKSFGGAFKDFYRLSTSKCYENINLESRGNEREILLLKFWILLCHGLNRVFEQHEKVLENYHLWVEPNTGLSEEMFWNWMSHETEQKIQQTVTSIKSLWFQQ